MDQIVVLALLRAQTGKSEELGERLSALVTTSRLEEGALLYDIHHSLEDPDLWMVYEIYRSKEDFDAHIQSPPLRAFAADFPALLDGGLDIKTFKMISTPAPLRP